MRKGITNWKRTRTTKKGFARRRRDKSEYVVYELKESDEDEEKEKQ